jgi:ATP-binding cassette, subfamily F, member 2
MVSDAKKKKAAAKKSKAGPPGSAPSSTAASRVASNVDLTGIADGVEDMTISDRSVTGVLTSHPQSRDVQIASLSLLFHGHELLMDTDLELNYGRCALCGLGCALNAAHACSRSLVISLIKLVLGCGMVF